MKNRATLSVVVVSLIVGCGKWGGPTGLLGPSAKVSESSSFDLVSTIAFSSNRDDPTNPNPRLASEIYLMDGDGTNPRRLTENSFGDGFASLSPDGKKIAFDSNRLRVEGEPQNTSDLFVMNTDGSEQTHLLRGSSATWSPDGRDIAFHASASGTGLPIKTDPGAATTDSDIFTANVDDVLAGSATRRNLTNSPEAIDDDPSWSPNGQQIVFTSHPVTDDPINSVHAEIYVMDTQGLGAPVRLTENVEEERAPSWSPDGTRIVFMWRKGGPDFEICVMNADGSGQIQLTDNTVGDFTPSWSPDGQRIVFHRQIGPQIQLWWMNADGTDQTQLTTPPGLNIFPSWGQFRIHVPQAALRPAR